MNLTNVFPPIPTVRRLLVVKPQVSGADFDFWHWLRCLQGLVNRDEPHLYLIRDEAQMRRKRRQFEEHWVQYYHDHYGVAIDRLDQNLERPVHDLHPLFGVQMFGHGRRALDVGEKDGDDPAFTSDLASGGQ